MTRPFQHAYTALAAPPRRRYFFVSERMRSAIWLVFRRFVSPEVRKRFHRTARRMIGKAGILASIVAIVGAAGTSERPSATPRSSSAQAAGSPEREGNGQEVNLSIREYSVESAKVSFENNANMPIYIAYVPTTSGLARLVYRVERRSRPDMPFRAFGGEIFDDYPPWNAVPAHTAVLFEALLGGEDFEGQYRITVRFFRNYDTVKLAEGALLKPEKEAKGIIDRRNRELEQAVSETISLPVEGTRVLVATPNLRAVNER